MSPERGVFCFRRSPLGVALCGSNSDYATSRHGPEASLLYGLKDEFPEVDVWLYGSQFFCARRAGGGRDTNVRRKPKPDAPRFSAGEKVTVSTLYLNAQHEWVPGVVLRCGPNAATVLVQLGDRQIEAYFKHAEMRKGWPE